MDVPAFGSITVDGIDSDESDDYFMRVTDFLTPLPYTLEPQAQLTVKN